MEGKKLYTLLVYSENIAGILNQITAVFTRRQVNIESLNVSASAAILVYMLSERMRREVPDWQMSPLEQAATLYRWARECVRDDENVLKRKFDEI